MLLLLSFGSFGQYILIYWTKACEVKLNYHYENTVTDDAEKVTLIDCNKEKLSKMIFLLWEGQGNPFLSVKKWSNPLQSETLPNKILMGH